MPRNMSNGHKIGGNLSLGLQSKLEMFGSDHCVFVRHGVGERMISACVFSTLKHGGGGGVTVWVCFAGDTVCDVFSI